MSSPTEKASHYSLEGVHNEWDAIAAVRKRLRDRDHLFMHFDSERGHLTNQYVEKTLNNVRLNRHQLQPLLRRMRTNALQLPIIDSVIEEIRSLYCCAKITVSYDVLYQEAWAARRLLSLAKNTLLHRKFMAEDSRTFMLCACSICFKNVYINIYISHLTLYYISSRGRASTAAIII